MGFCSNCGCWVDEGDICPICGGSLGYGGNSTDGLSQKLSHMAYSASESRRLGRTDEAIRENMDIIVEIIESERDSSQHNLRSYYNDPQGFYNEALFFMNNYGSIRILGYQNVIKDYYRNALNEIGSLIGSEKRDKAWNLYMNFNSEKALYYINLALDEDDRDPQNWNVKGIILEDMKNFEESLRCYDRSLSLAYSDKVLDNKTRMQYDWANEMLKQAKERENGLVKLYEARGILKQAIDSFPREKSEESIDKYIQLDERINFYINLEKENQSNLETLKRYSKNELFTITGMFYHGDAELKPGMPLRLVKEPENEYDRDAIAVYANGEKIGYVANSDFTKSDYTSSASEIHDAAGDNAEFLFALEKNGSFHIARLINGGYFFNE